MPKIVMVLAILLFSCTTWAQTSPKKYPWQGRGTSCTPTMTFCWYGSDLVKDPEVTAYGNRWVSQDKDEKPFEWVTEVRCIQVLHLCILARNQEVPFVGGTLSSIDLYYVKEWSEHEIRAVEESDFSHGQECEIDTLLLNREEASVSILSVPGPAATTKRCDAVMKPKTVLYKPQLGSPQPHGDTP
jgi:hypothetical protein